MGGSLHGPEGFRLCGFHSSASRTKDRGSQPLPTGKLWVKLPGASRTQVQPGRNLRASGLCVRVA